MNNKKNIEAFLSYGDRKIERDWITIAMIITIGLLCGGVYFSKEKIINGIICGLFSLAMIIGCLYFQFKVPFNRKTKNLFHGIYLCFCSLGCQYLSYKMLIKVWNCPAALIVLLISCSLIVFACQYFITMRRIRDGFYLQSKEPGIAKGIIAVFAVGGTVSARVFANQMENGFCLFMGIPLAFIGIVLMTSVWFIMKYHFYKELEQMTDE